MYVIDIKKKKKKKKKKKEVLNFQMTLQITILDLK